MKYKTLIWSGCSHSYGSGIFQENGHKLDEDLETKPVEWSSPKCYDDFPNVVSVADAMREVALRAYPMQIGKKMGFENTYNLSVPGHGIETQFRKVTSFIIENEDKIDFSKAVFCYQIPAFNRVEVLDSRNSDSLFFSVYNFQVIEENGDFAKNYYLNHFDFDYYVAKFLMYLYEYKGFIESKGIKFLPFQFYEGKSINEAYDKLYPYIKSEEIITGKNGMNRGRGWEQIDVRFPNRKTIVEKIQHWDIKWRTPLQPGTLASEGYCNDGHWSPKGHDVLADNLIPQLKEKLGLNDKTKRK
jgi:hypothetical protein